MSKTYYTTFYPEEDTIGSKGSAAFLAYTAKLTVYKRSITTPAAPSGGSYNFDGGVLTPPSGWTVDIAAGSDPIFVSYAEVSTFVRNDVVTTLTWTTPVEIFRSGTIGVSPISVTISRPFLIVPADSNGQNPVLTNTGTEIRVFEGVTPVVFNGTGTNGVGGNSGGGTGNLTWRIASAVATGVTPGAITDSGNYATTGNITGITADTASIVYTIVGLNSVDDPFEITVTQSFSRFTGAVIDSTAPATPAQPTFDPANGTLITTTAGDVQIRLTATWTANTEPDLSYYIVAIQEGAGTFIEYSTTSNRYEWLVKPNTSYTVKVKAVDKSDNRSGFSPVRTATTTTDSTVPGLPTALTAAATFKNIFLSWTNTNGATDGDLEAIEIWEATTNNSASATKIATVNAVKGAPGGFTRSGITNGTTYYYFLKSVDTSSNTSAFSTTNSTATNQSSVSVATGGVFTLTGNSTPLSLGNVVTITGTRAGTGTISNYASGTNYVVSATNGSTTATLVAADGTALTTTAGTITGLTFTVVRSAAIPAAVGTLDIIAGSITADRIQAASLTGDRFNTTTSLPGTITVGSTGVSIGTIQSDAADPATKINGGSTTIQPGKIQIDGPTTLSSWIKGGDVTKIDGGAISANTISANKLTVGLRGVDISGIEFTSNVNSNAEPTHIVSWTAGSISYANNNSTIVNQTNVPSGTITQARVTGTVTATYSGTTITLTYPVQSSAPYFRGEKIFVSGITATTNAPNGAFTVASSTTTQTVYTATLTPTGTLAGTILLGSGQLQYIYWPKPPEGTVTATYSGTTITLTYPVQSSAPYTAGEQIVVRGITATTNAPNGAFTVASSTTTQTVYTATLTPTGTLGSTILLNSSIPVNTTITPTYSGTTITLTYPTQGSAPYSAGQQIVVSGITATTNAPNGTFTVVSSTTTQTVYTATAVPTGTLGTTVSLGSGISGSRASGTANRENTIVLGTYAGGVDLVINYGRTIIDGSQITTGTIRGDRVVANSITADKIDSRSLSIKDAAGNVILAAGTALDYTNVGGTKPPANATNGATFGTNIGGQITQGNASTFIADAAIGSAQIGSIQLVGTNNFNVKSAASGARTEIDSQVIKIFDATGPTGTLRVKIGNLAL